MENPKLDIRNLMDKVSRPLPKPEEEVKRFAGVFPNLSDKEVLNILTVVIDNISKSRGYGLYLKPSVQFREEVFYLTAINTFGGPSKIVQEYSQENISKLIGDAAYNEFEKESRQDFLKLNKKGTFGGSKNRFYNHLEFTRGELLNKIFNQQI